MKTAKLFSKINADEIERERKNKEEALEKNENKEYTDTKWRKDLNEYIMQQVELGKNDEEIEKGIFENKKLTSFNHFSRYTMFFKSWIGHHRENSIKAEEGKLSGKEIRNIYNTKLTKVAEVKSDKDEETR
ncbi:MAG: hypothetical protein J6M60_03270 [Clostridia bacterium]|nr:hypothetical protein [Clostridia bacterium]